MYSAFELPPHHEADSFYTGHIDYLAYLRNTGQLGISPPISNKAPEIGPSLYQVFGSSFSGCAEDVYGSCSCPEPRTVSPSEINPRLFALETANPVDDLHFLEESSSDSNDSSFSCASSTMSGSGSRGKYLAHHSPPDDPDSSSDESCDSLSGDVYIPTIRRLAKKRAHSKPRRQYNFVAARPRKSHRSVEMTHSSASPLPSPTAQPSVVRSSSPADTPPSSLPSSPSDTGLSTPLRELDICLDKNSGPRLRSCSSAASPESSAAALTSSKRLFKASTPHASPRKQTSSVLTDNLEEPKRTSSGRYLCDRPGCRHTTANKHDLVRHQQGLTHAPKSFKCYGCGFAYTRPDALKRHLRGKSSCKATHNAGLKSLGLENEEDEV